MLVLVPHPDDYWRATSRCTAWCATTTPPAPSTERADQPHPGWKSARGNAGTDFTTLTTQILDAVQSRYAFCDVLDGAPAIFQRGPRRCRLPPHQRLDRPRVARQDDHLASISSN